MARHFTDITLADLDDRINQYVMRNKDVCAGGNLYATYINDQVMEVYVQKPDRVGVVDDLFMIWSEDIHISHYVNSLNAMRKYFCWTDEKILSIRVKRRVILDGYHPVLVRFFHNGEHNIDNDGKLDVYSPMAIGNIVSHLEMRRIKPKQVCCIGYGNLFTKVMNEIENNLDYKLGLVKFQFLLK